jgi:hypothetical protein
MDHLDERVARLRTHRNNIDRYRRLLKSKLTDVERQYLEKRMCEERSALDTLRKSFQGLSRPADRATPKQSW